MSHESTDLALADIIKADLLDDSRLSLHPICASVKNGIVTLSGNVQTYRRKLLEHQIASGHDGVVEVVNSLRSSSL